MPNLFSEATRAQIERYMRYLFTQTCTIEQQARSRTVYGSESNVWVTVARDVPCRVIKNGQTIDSRTEMVGGQESIVNSPRIVAPLGTQFAKDQRITLDTGEVFTVTGVRTNLTSKVTEEAFCVRAD